MTITRNIKIVFCLLMFPFCCAMAQEEYTWEMGGVIGGSFYMGDANSSTPFKDTGIAGFTESTHGNKRQSDSRQDFR